jgi:hypothetical protein
VSTREKEAEGWIRASWEREVRREVSRVERAEGLGKGRRRTGNCVYSDRVSEVKEEKGGENAPSRKCP